MARCEQNGYISDTDRSPRGEVRIALNPCGCITRATAATVIRAHDRAASLVNRALRGADPAVVIEEAQQLGQLLDMPEEPAEAPAPPTLETGAYMPITPFDPDDQSGGRYQAEVDAEGPLIYSECCMDRMSLATARQFHAALGRWIADQDAERSDR